MGTNTRSTSRGVASLAGKTLQSGTASVRRASSYLSPESCSYWLFSDPSRVPERWPDRSIARLARRVDAGTGYRAGPGIQRAYGWEPSEVEAAWAVAREDFVAGFLRADNAHRRPK